MTNQERTSRVLMSLVAAMTAGAIVLMALDNQSLSGGAFSLASYTQLDPVEKVVSQGLGLNRAEWGRIEIYLGNSSSAELAALIGLRNSEETNSHFVVYNGKAGEDGFIQATNNWQRQQPCGMARNWLDGQTIRVCVIIAEGAAGQCSDCQRKRTMSLIDSLSRKFNVPANKISYPLNWQL